MKNLQSNLIKHLFFLIAIFIFGFCSIMLTNFLSSVFKKELDKKTLHLENKIKLAEYIAEDLFKIKSDYYELALTEKKQKRILIQNRLKEKVNSIKRILEILQDGGTLKREIKLNISGYINDIKLIELRKKEIYSSIKTSDILPKLNHLLVMTKKLIGLLDLKKECSKKNELLKLKELNQKIRIFYESSPYFFAKIIEKSRKILYEGELELREIKKEIIREKKHYDHIGNIIIVLTSLFVIFFGWFTAKEISRNNIRLKKLNRDLAKKIKQTLKQENFIRGVLNSQSSIILVNNGKEIIDANSTLLYFFEQFKTYQDLKKQHRCISDFFVIPDDVPTFNAYITDKDYNGKNWIEYILKNPSIPHKVAMMKKGLLHHFYIWATQKRISKDELVVIITLNDITYDISRQKKLKILNTTLENSLSDIKNLLNNSNQGFLSFSQDLIIKKQHSKICHKFFMENLSGKNISELLYPNRLKRKKFFENTIKSLDLKDKSFKNSTILSLLQNEFILNKRVVSVEYKVLDSDTFMMILTDITEKRILEKKVNREAKILKMVLSVVSHREEFIDLLEEYRIFIDNLSSSIHDNQTPLRNCNTLFMDIHTFKGLFLQKELIYTSHFLHKFETKLSEFMELDGLSNDSLRNIIDKNSFIDSLNQDLNIIEEIAEDNFFQAQKSLTIKEEEINKIEQKILSLDEKCLMNHKFGEILSDFKNLKNKPFHLLMDSYPKFISQMSQRLGKSIYPLDLKIDKNIAVTYNIKPFVQSLIHIFRNAIDHGIEPIEERIFKNKIELGTIGCKIYVENKKLKIIISDDGRGIDIEKIKLKAQILSIETINLNNEELVQLIFNQKFSTKNEISDISGRGVGLSAVKKELDKIGGEVSIDTTLGKGTAFYFTLPINYKGGDFYDKRVSL